VSIYERVEEAINFRKELRKLEVSEKHRVQNLRRENFDFQFKRLGEKHLQEKKLLQMRLIEEKNKLTIQMGKDYSVLCKQIKLHEHEIKRIMGLATKFALKKGKNEGELQRTKIKSRKTNAILKRTKKIESKFDQSTISPHNTTSNMSNSSKKFPQKMSYMARSGRGAIKTLQKLTKSKKYSKFYIRQQFGSDLPVNMKINEFNRESGDNHHKIERYLIDDQAYKKKKLPSLAALYDDNLEVIDDHLVHPFIPSTRPFMSYLS